MRLRSATLQQRRWLVLSCLVMTCIAPRAHGQAPNGSAPLRGRNTPVPASYFGLHIHRAVSLSPNAPSSVWPDIGFASWRLWDAHVAWPNLEPERGKWDFTMLDSLVALAESHHVRILLTLGLTPRWASSRPDEPSNYDPGNQAPPRDLADWRDYVRAVASRYRGRIQEYEVWNEANLRGFFSGSQQDLLALASSAYETIKSVDPSATVTSPAVTGQLAGATWLGQYLALGGARYADAVTFHFYTSPAPPERMLASIDSVRAVMASNNLAKAPLWNTETGWFLQNRFTTITPSSNPKAFKGRVLDASESIEWPARALILGWCAGLDRFYWYAWDNREMGFTEADGHTVKPPAMNYATVRRWLVGARLPSCGRASTGLWTVSVLRSGGEESVLVWTDGNHDQRIAPSLAARVDSVSRLPDGRTKRVTATAARALVIGGLPIMLHLIPVKH